MPDPTQNIRPSFGGSSVMIVAYLITLASMATIGVIVPIMTHMSVALGASMAELGFTIGLFSLPSALLSVLSGGLVDRAGPKLTLMISAGVAIVADITVFGADNLTTVQIAMVGAGIANTGIITAVPALLMNVLTGDERIRAMSLWSTYGPAGYAVGLLLAAPFATGSHWQLAILVLAVIMTLTTLAAAVVLPSVKAGAQPAARISAIQMFGIFRDVPLLRICIAYGVVASVSYGSSLAAPAYLSQIYDVSISSSATAVAAAKIVAMLLGGVGMGWLLSRVKGRMTIFAIVSTLGIIAQFFLYFPGSGMIAATAAMILWLFAYGGIAAVCFVMLAHINTGPGRSGLASGLMGQIASIGCFVAPPLYFAIEWWPAYILIAAGGLCISFIVFPTRGASDQYALAAQG